MSKPKSAGCSGSRSCGSSIGKPSMAKRLRPCSIPKQRCARQAPRIQGNAVELAASFPEIERCSKNFDHSQTFFPFAVWPWQEQQSFLIGKWLVRHKCDFDERC